MKKASAAMAAVALAAAPATARANETVDLEGRYGTSSCYVYVDEPLLSPPTIQPTWPFIVFPPGAPPMHEVHCPIPPRG